MENPAILRRERMSVGPGKPGFWQNIQFMRGLVSEKNR